MNFLAFFCSFMVSEDFLLISWRDRLYSVEKKAPSHHSMLFICVRVNVSAEQPWHYVPLIYSLVYLPLAWSLSSWLAVFFHSSIRSCSGVTMPSIRALGDEGAQDGDHRRLRGMWKGNVWPFKDLYTAMF